MATTIFTSPICPWSQKAKDFLTKQKVHFEEKDLSEDKPARKEVLDLSGQVGTPVIKIGDEVLIGFNEAKIKEALKKL
ncbi:glutaredoxin family protein [archaeon]|jgi:glutaredoxin 3|nr:glutaredoxin family protein [archaeon]MBT6698039.1 glutaredoxin family protein [archaeon]